MKESFYNLKRDIWKDFSKSWRLKREMDTYDYRNEMILHGKKHYKHGQTTNKKNGEKKQQHIW